MNQGVAIFGAGRIGSVHFRNCLLNTEVDIRWLVDVDVSRATSLLKKYRCEDKVKVASVQELSTVLDDSSVDFVMVCTPSSCHEDIVIAALNAGKAVFCEKPLSLSQEGSKNCYRAAQKNKRPLFCAFNRRFDPSICRIYDQVSSGRLGKLRSIRSVTRDTREMLNMDYIRTSGGILVDSVVHNIDTICWFTGQAPHSVYATGHALHPGFAACSDVDTVFVVLEFPSGVKAHIEVNRNADINHDMRMEVFGEKGLLHLHNISDINTSLVNHQGETRDPFQDDFMRRFADSYRLEVEHFVAVLQGKAKEVVTATDVLMVEEVVAACQLSLKTGQVVKCNATNIDL